MMNVNELNSKVETLMEYEALIAEAKAIRDTLQDELKAFLTEIDEESYDTGNHVIRYTSVASSRFDTKLFKERMGADMYKLFTKEVASKRFSVA